MKIVKGIKEGLWKHVHIRRSKKEVGPLLTANAIKSRNDAEKQKSSVLISLCILHKGILKHKQFVRVKEVQFKRRHNRREPWCEISLSEELHSKLLGKVAV